MKDLKDYLRENIEPLSSYIKKHMDSVYTEEKRPKDKVRIWLSYDVEDGYEEKYDHLYKLFDALGAEQWGNSVATFLLPISQTPNNEMIANILVNILMEKELLDGDNFEDEEWKKTKGLSFYVIYRYSYYDETKKKDILNSDHFVLLHNAPIKHLDGWSS